MDVIMLCNKLVGKPVLAMGLRFGIIEVLNLLVTNFWYGLFYVCNSSFGNGIVVD